jgi:hypothetical protein
MSRLIALGSELTRQIMVAVRTLVKEQPTTPVPIVTASVAEEFERADRWLRPMRI